MFGFFFVTFFWVDFTQKCKFSARHLFECGSTQMPRGPTSGRFLLAFSLRLRPSFVLTLYCKRQKPRLGPGPKVRGGYFFARVGKEHKERLR